MRGCEAKVRVLYIHMYILYEFFILFIELHPRILAHALEAATTPTTYRCEARNQKKYCLATEGELWKTQREKHLLKNSN